MNFIIPALQSADTFPQAVACAPRRCGGGKVSAGGASFRFRGVALLSVLGGSVRTLGWLYFAVQLALMGRYLQGGVILLYDSVCEAVANQTSNRIKRPF